jgi:hypothetical protein
MGGDDLPLKVGVNGIGVGFGIGVTDWVDWVMVDSVCWDESVDWVDWVSWEKLVDWVEVEDWEGLVDWVGTEMLLN